MNEFVPAHHHQLPVDESIDRSNPVAYVVNYCNRIGSPQDHQALMVNRLSKIPTL